MRRISVTLGEAADEISTGMTPPTSNPIYFNGSIPWFTPGDIGQTRLLEKAARTISWAALESGKAKLFQPQSLLVTCIGNVGRVGVLQQPSSSNQQITALRFKSGIDVDFAYFWFLANQHQLEARTNQAVVPILNNTQLREIPFSYPPLDEQRRIAEQLSMADRQRRLRRYALELSEGYLQAVFLEMFGDPLTNPMGWEEVELACVGTLDRGKSKHRPRNAPHLYDGTYPFVQTGEVANAEGYIYGYSQTYSEAGLMQSKLWSRGTLCITIAANIAKSAILTFDACFPDSVVGFHANARTTVEFVQTWLSFLQKSIEDNAPESAQKNINLQLLRHLEIILPPLPLQQDFARIVRQHERLRTQQREALRQADHLFDTLLHRAFSGE